MAEDGSKDWRELCNAAIAANDTDELLHVIEQLNEELEREEKMHRRPFEAQVARTDRRRYTSPANGH